MSKRNKRVISILLTLAVIFMLPAANVSAKKNTVTDAQLKKAMKCYADLLATNPYESVDGGFTAETFLLKDLDLDGMPELVINGDAPQIFSYDLKNNTEIFMYNSWVSNTLYYSSKTKTILYTYEWKGKKEWSFYQVKNTQENDAFSIMEPSGDFYSYTDGKYDEYASNKVKKGYYIGYYGSEDAKKTTKKALDKAINKLVPDKTELKTTIKNTSANRKKYLSNLKEFKKFSGAK